MLALQAEASRLDADTLDTLILQEVVEDTQSIGAATDTGDHFVRQPPLRFEYLCPGFPADDRLNIAYHHRIGVRAGNR